MLEPGKITRSGGTSKGSAQKDTLLREASKALIRQGKMWVIASRAQAAVDEPLLVPDRLQRAGRYLGDEALEVRLAQRPEAGLVGHRVGIAGVERRAQPAALVRRDQDQARVQVGLEQLVDVDVLRQVAPAVEVLRLVDVGRRDWWLVALLHLQPLGRVDHVVLLRQGVGD